MTSDPPFVSAQELDELRLHYDVIPIVRRIALEGLTPAAVFREVARGSSDAFLFESAEAGETGRYSFIGHDGRRSRRFERGEPDCAQKFRHELRPLRVHRREELPPFIGGAVGYFGYDVARWSEQIPDRHPSTTAIPDACLLFFDSAVILDHEDRTVTVITNLFATSDMDSKSLLTMGVQKVEDTVASIGRSRTAATGSVVRLSSQPDHSARSPVFTSNCSPDEFAEMVRRAQEEITAGEIFQIVLSQRWETAFPTSRSLELYEALRTLNPSPYMFLLRTKECTLVGTSPEMLVRVLDSTVATRPIAGTRARAATPEGDVALEAELRDDPKENAEHLMLVDLGRNDVGRVSKQGSVNVTEFAKVERYSHVMHLVSNVTGVLRDDVTSIDAFLASFPAGTVSGAPKIRAMELIDEIENARRGPYAGAVAYFDFGGNLDSCITIRTVVLVNDRALVQAGAGIVYDSDPDKEFIETENKAAALKQAIIAAAG
ncbi:MAG TPA: chorismate-binding protein [Thermoanaerobaculia bacterium]|nr:chorismate-binding protein [Thermoanaerobaculia bacterium]